MSSTSHTETPAPVRRTAAERGLPPIPWGWFVVGLSHELAPGQVLALRYFDRDLVLFRTEGGQARLWDAHCPHLGAHLGHGGRVEGETLRCAFHHWRFDGDGRCVEVPGCDKIPPKAKAGPWSVCEHNGAIHAWFHPEGLPPSTEVPVLPDEGWTEPLAIRWFLRSHPQEIGENTVDTAHMKPVHETGRSQVLYGPDLDGPVMRIGLQFVASGEIIGMEGDNDLQLDVEMWGVGMIRVQAHVLNAGVRARYRICSTPIDQNTIHIYGIANMEQTDDPEFTREVAGLFFEALTKDFVKDFPIWENKMYRAQPNLSAADGPIGAYRKWARQFYPQAPTVRRAAVQPTAPSSPPQPTRRARAADVLHSVRGLLSRVRGVVDGGGNDASNGRAPGNGHAGGNGHAAGSGHAGANGHAGSNGRATGSGHGSSHGHAGGNGHAADNGHATSNDPARRSAVPRVDSVADYFETLGERFVPSATRGMDAVFQWKLRGDQGASYHAIVRDGSMELVSGTHQSPTVTIAMDADDYVKVVNGELDGTRAFTTGSGKVSGKLRMAMKMRAIFPQG